MNKIVKLMTHNKYINFSYIRNNLPPELLKELDNLKESFSEQEILEYIIQISQQCLNKFFNKLLYPNHLEAFNLTIITRQGGQDAQELSELLLKMYISFLNKVQIKHKIIDIKKAEVGLHQAIVSVYNTNLFPFFINETGIHRIERYSPFKKQKKIYTSSIEISVMPIFTQPRVNLINNLLKINPIKASGPGGQYINKAMTGVLINYKNFNIRVTTYRSFEQNKNQAIQLLKSKILFNKIFKHRKKALNIYNIYSTNQIIRTYDFVLNYVKLHLQKIKIKNAQRIIKGDLEPILMYNILYATRQTCNKII